MRRTMRARRFFLTGTLLGGLGLFLPGRTAKAACPSSPVTSLTASLAQCGTSTSYNLSWTAPSGVDAGTVYEVLAAGPYASYCEVPLDFGGASFRTLGTTAQTAYAATGLSANVVYLFAVRVLDCLGTLSQNTPVVDTFTAAPRGPAVSAAPGTGAVTLTYSMAEGNVFSLRALERRAGNGSFAAVPGYQNVFQNYCPVGSQKTFTDQGLPEGVYEYRFGFRNAATCAQTIYSTPVKVVVGCPAPGAPVLTSSAASVLPGTSLPVSWTASPSLAPDGAYEVQTSRDGFATVDSSVRTAATSTVVATPGSGQQASLQVRVRAVQACGAVSVSNVVSVTLQSAAQVNLTRQGPSWETVKGTVPPPATVGYRNTGSATTTLTFSSTSAFFTFQPPAVEAPPGVEVFATVTATAAAVASSGPRQSGALVATYPGAAAPVTVTTSVSLQVLDSEAASGAKAQADQSSLLFVAPAGQNPGSQQLRVNVSGGSLEVPVYLIPTIEPGGAWLSLSDDVSRPLTSPGEVTITLSVDRARRSREEGSGLLRTVLRLTPQGGDPALDAAVVEVVDQDDVTVQSGTGVRAGRRLPLAAPPGGTSFIVPTAVKATGRGGESFTSDGWLRNLSPRPVEVELYCTPDGKDGIVDPGILLTYINLAPSATYRLSDLMATVFKTSGVSANVEVRSSLVNALSLRTAVDSIKANDPASRFGTEIPTVSFGSGAALGGAELIVPGVDADDANRANLILAETAGSGATVSISVNGPDGALLRTLTRDVPPFSKVQVNSADLAPGSGSLSGGWVGVRVTAGDGRVVPVATIIDNRSGSFSAALGQRGRPAAAGAREPLAGQARYVIPSVARTRGAFDTQFITSMSLVNGTDAAANLTLTYRYVDQDDRNLAKTVQKPLTLPRRGAMPKNLAQDVIGDFFGVRGRSYGSIVVEGDLTRVVGFGSVSALVDPADPGKGLKTAQVLGVFLDSPSLMARGLEERRFAGVEQSFQKRSNLVLLEVDGQPASVLVRLYSKTGDRLGEKRYEVEANQYLQVNAVVTSEQGLRIGDGPFQDVEVTAQVVEGTGRVLGLATVIDNISRNPEIFLLVPPAPPGDPTIGF